MSKLKGKIKKAIQNNRKLLFGMIIGFSVTIVGAATILFASDEVSYDNSSSDLTSTDVQGAIDEIYTKANTCLSNYNYTCSGSSCPKCVRATRLHTEICSPKDPSYYCIAAGYTASGSKGSTKIIYGKTKKFGTTLETGDAFDCDVNGDGVYNSFKERFYYVSDYWMKPNSGSDTYDNSYAVLIYYTNTKNGEPKLSGAAYNLSDYGDEGPVTAATHLPTTSQWSNVSLIKTSRQLYNELGDETTNNGGTRIPVFSYSGYAARLLTYQELNNGCYNGSTAINVTGGLEKCNFLFENTTFTSSKNNVTVGSWSETPCSDSSSKVWRLSGYTRSIYNGTGANVTYYGVRPSIEIAKSDMLY